MLNWCQEELENLSRGPFLETSRPSIDLGSAKSADAKKNPEADFGFTFEKIGLTQNLTETEKNLFDNFG